MVTHGHIAPLPDPGFRHIARGQILDQPRRIRPGQFDLPLRRDIPHGHPVHQRVIFPLGVAEMRWYEHVIIDRETSHTLCDGRIEIGGFAIIRANADLKRHGEDPFAKAHRSTPMPCPMARGSGPIGAIRQAFAFSDTAKPRTSTGILSKVGGARAMAGPRVCLGCETPPRHALPTGARQVTARPAVRARSAAPLRYPQRHPACARMRTAGCCPRRP